MDRRRAAQAVTAALRKKAERERKARRRQIEQIKLGKKDPRQRRPQTWEKLLYAGVTLANLGLTVYLHSQKRREIIHAVEQNEDVLVLVRENARPVTKVLNGPKIRENGEEKA